MTRNEAKLLLSDPSFIAWAEGKEVEYGTAIGWHPVRDGSTFNSDTYQGHSDHRVKPQPTIRPWRPEEVPVGALIRDTRMPSKVSVILGATIIDNYPRAIIEPSIWGHSEHYLNDLFTYHGGGNYRIEHSLDHGKTWLTCGVVE